MGWDRSRWVFKDYFSRHSDIHWHENQFLGRRMTTFGILYVDLRTTCAGTELENIMFKNPPQVTSGLPIACWASTRARSFEPTLWSLRVKKGGKSQHLASFLIETRGFSHISELLRGFKRYFWIFFNNKKWVFAFFIKLVWLGVGFFNRTGAEMGY